jgi:hypothetical protein
MLLSFASISTRFALLAADLASSPWLGHGQDSFRVCVSLADSRVMSRRATSGSKAQLTDILRVRLAHLMLSRTARDIHWNVGMFECGRELWQNRELVARLRPTRAPRACVSRRRHID